ncbi:hypothetical protein [Stenotrophomonas sp. PD6]|uniref:hypothetical protein n=1 Tax=Stenotrophomonas sp. PD6 TaxID=3368612 RepID=UPI003BA1DF24
MKQLLRKLFDRATPTADAPASEAPARGASPTVPANLRERLRKHPAHIERLQQALDGVTIAGREGIPRFELAVWALEGRMGTFLSEARDELDAARAAGDRKEVKRAEANVRLMSEIRLKQVWIGDTALWNHFGKPEGSAP